MEQQNKPPAPLLPGHQDTFARLERLLTHTGGFDLIFLRYDDKTYRDRIVGYLNDSFHSGVLNLAETRWTSFLIFEEALGKLARKMRIVQILNLNLGRSNTRDERWLRGFNYHREALAALQPCLVFWVREEELEVISTGAPDWWSWRSGVLDFGTIATQGLGEDNASSAETRGHDALGISGSAVFGREKEVVRRILQWFSTSGLNVSLEIMTGRGIQDGIIRFGEQEVPVEIQSANRPLKPADLNRVISRLKSLPLNGPGMIVSMDRFSPETIAAATQSRPHFPLLLVDGDHLRILRNGLDGRRWLYTYQKLANQRNTAWVPIKDIHREMEGAIEFDYDIFISHAHADRDWARRLFQLLTAGGRRVWFDEQSLDSLESHELAALEGISRSRHTVVLLSPNYVLSKWAQREFDEAGLLIRGNRERRLLPILIKNGEIPAALRPFHYLDACPFSGLEMAV